MHELTKAMGFVQGSRGAMDYIENKRLGAINKKIKNKLMSNVLFMIKPLEHCARMYKKQKVPDGG